MTSSFDLALAICYELKIFVDKYSLVALSKVMKGLISIILSAIMTRRIEYNTKNDKIYL